MDNKVWLLIPSNIGYDSFEGFVVVAPTEEKAISMAKESLYDEHQLPFKVQEVDLSTPQIILEAFRDG